jgi:hypothetical protein
MQTRRKFLRDCSFAGIVASLGSAVIWARDPTWGMGLLQEPGFAEFAGQVNTFFRVQAGSNTIRLLLVEATPFSPATPDTADAGNEKFTLRFRGPARPPLAQDTYRFDHPRLGRPFIFIVPHGGLDTTHCYYEAIFDRPVNAAQLAVQLALAPRRAQT